MKKLSLIIAAVFVFGVANAVVSPSGDSDEAVHQVSLNIDEITLLDIEDGSGNSSAGFSFTLNPSDFVSEAGQAFNNSINLSADGKTSYLQYTALVASNKYIKAEITSSDLPEGFNLNVKAGKANSGKGKVGKEKGFQTITKSGSEIVSEIGTCYTGTGGSNGHKLDYQLEIDDKADIAKLTSGDFDVTVTYTITE